jgi:hypothetical protein
MKKKNDEDQSHSRVIEAVDCSQMPGLYFVALFKYSMD